MEVQHVAALVLQDTLLIHPLIHALYAHLPVQPAQQVPLLVLHAFLTTRSMELLAVPHVQQGM